MKQMKYTLTFGAWLFCCQPGLLLACGISGAHILGVHLSVSTNSRKAYDLQITASEACSMVAEPLPVQKLLAVP